MLSNRIVGSAAFLQMPLETQALYFHLCLKADDDGVVEAYPVIKVTGVADDSLRILVSKNFVYPLDQDLVLYVVAWDEHNKIRPDRIVKSIHRDLLLKKLPNVKLIEPKPRTDVEDNSRRLRGPSTDGLSKVKLSKDRNTASKRSSEPMNAGSRASGNISDLLLKTRGQLKERGVL